MSNKIRKFFKLIVVKGSPGLAQIPLMIGLLLMAVAIPAVTTLVQQNQDSRNLAAGCSSSVVGKCGSNGGCTSGYRCISGSGVFNCSFDPTCGGLPTSAPPTATTRSCTKRDCSNNKCVSVQKTVPSNQACPASSCAADSECVTAPTVTQRPTTVSCKNTGASVSSASECCSKKANYSGSSLVCSCIASGSSTSSAGDCCTGIASYVSSVLTCVNPPTSTPGSGIFPKDGANCTLNTGIYATNYCKDCTNGYHLTSPNATGGVCGPQTDKCRDNNGLYYKINIPDGCNCWTGVAATTFANTCANGFCDANKKCSSPPDNGCGKLSDAGCIDKYSNDTCTFGGAGMPTYTGVCVQSNPGSYSNCKCTSNIKPTSTPTAKPTNPAPTNTTVPTKKPTATLVPTKPNTPTPTISTCISKGGQCNTSKDDCCVEGEVCTPGGYRYYCAPINLTTGACKNGAVKCSNGFESTCNVNGVWIPQTKRCDYGCNATTNKCNVGCNAGEKKCEIAGGVPAVATCANDGTGWTRQSCSYGCDSISLSCRPKPSDNCIGSTSNSAATPVPGKCNTSNDICCTAGEVCTPAQYGYYCIKNTNPCTEGQVKCANGFESTCNNNGVWVPQTKKCGYECNAKTNRCNTGCTPGDRKCTMAGGVSSVAICADDGTGWKNQSCTNDCNETTKFCNGEPTPTILPTKIPTTPPIVTNPPGGGGGGNNPPVVTNPPGGGGNNPPGNNCNEQCPGSDGVLRSCTPPDPDGTSQDSTCNVAGRIESCGGKQFCCPVAGGSWTTSMTACTTKCTQCSAGNQVELACYESNTEDIFKWAPVSTPQTGFTEVYDEVCFDWGVEKPITSTGASKIRGDADCDGATTINDYQIWIDEFKAGGLGQTNKNTWRADFDCNGVVDINDYQIWIDNFKKVN